MRARGLSIFITIFFGAMALGSIPWGQVASHIGIPSTQLITAAGALLVSALSWRFKLLQGEGLNHSPSGYWPQPVVAEEITLDRGPVMVTVEYLIATADTAESIEAMCHLKASRERHGAYAWGLFEDVAVPGRMLEYSIEESWVTHMRHHRRISVLDNEIQDRARRFHRPDANPAVTHFLAPDANRPPPSGDMPSDKSMQ